MGSRSQYSEVSSEYSAASSEYSPLGLEECGSPGATPLAYSDERAIQIPFHRVTLY